VREKVKKDKCHSWLTNTCDMSFKITQNVKKITLQLLDQNTFNPSFRPKLPDSELSPRAVCQLLDLGGEEGVDDKDKRFGILTKVEFFFATLAEL